MPMFEIDYTYKVEEYGVVTLDALNVEDAEAEGLHYVRMTFPDVTDVEIDAVRELPVNGT